MGFVFQDWWVVQGLILNMYHVNKKVNSQKILIFGATLLLDIKTEDNYRSTVLIKMW